MKKMVFTLLAVAAQVSATAPVQPTQSQLFADRLMSHIKPHLSEDAQATTFQALVENYVEQLPLFRNYAVTPSAEAAVYLDALHAYCLDTFRLAKLSSWLRKPAESKQLLDAFNSSKALMVQVIEKAAASGIASERETTSELAKINNLQANMVWWFVESGITIQK